ncbi:MAG TPA: hypothetical protein VMD79_01085 [Solirubrobacteraceae bacterium]|nr:hypothetical protein [Solirubrobacteraceae bacterium]
MSPPVATLPAPAATRARGAAAPARRLLALTLAPLALALAPAARADVFSPISLVSYGTVGGGGFVQQAEYAHDAAISANGVYVVFDGSIGGVTGVWRRDLETDVIEQVAGGDAAMPSISGEGRYVSFTTNEGASLPEITHALPDSDAHTEAVNVYRRDMNVAPAAGAAEEAARAPDERAFLAASVPSGSEAPLSYAYENSVQREHGGSYAVGRTAMSENGAKVAFVTAAVSNLVPYPALEEAERDRGETPLPHTPAAQVAVHDFETGTTELVSRCESEEEPDPCGRGAAEGAAEPVVTAEAERKPLGAATIEAADFPLHEPHGSWPGASISADGTTVAWIGEDIAQQAPTLAHEDLEALYQEPLWRRLPAAANRTRRVTGGSDPEDPACAASGELRLPIGSENAGDPCQGPFVRESASTNTGGGLIKASLDEDDYTPRLSRNGEEVVFGANARLLSQGSDYGRGENGNETNLFLASMQPGLARTQALTPLTETGDSEATEAPIGDYEISPDGEQVAFTTTRTLFTLGQPTLVSPPLGAVGISELYDADLADGTLTRVTHGYAGEGEASEQPVPASYTNTTDPYKLLLGVVPDRLGALTPDFSGDGDELVFSSTAGNLVYGDGNSPPEPVDCCQAGDGSDVFLVTRRTFVAEPTPQSISPNPPQAIVPPWRLDATAQARPDGSVALYVMAPGTGRLAVEARGGVVRVLTVRTRGRRPERRRLLATRTLAVNGAVETASGGGLMELLVRVQPPYASLTGAADGLPASLALTFTSPGRPTLHQTLAVVFRRTERAGKAKKSAVRHGAKTAHRARRPR